jgi:hypothetical protein
MSATLPLEVLRALSSLFTRPAFKALSGAYGQDAAQVHLGRTGVLVKGKPQPLRELLETVFEHLERDYRNEYVFKSAIANGTLARFPLPGDASVQIEMPIHSSILDVAVASDTTRAYEIKTDYDSSRRLDSQTLNYLRAYDEVYLVASSKMLSKFAQGVDPRVGLITLEQDGSLNTVRQATSNRSNLQAYEICWGLRRAEQVGALEHRTGQRIVMPNGIVGTWCEKQFMTIPSLELHDIFLEAMRKRSLEKFKDNFIHRLPRSLRALGFATPLSGIGQRRLLENLDKSVPFALPIS